MNNNRCVIKFNGEGYANIEGDQLVHSDDFIYVYRENQLQGAFHLSAINCIYINERRGDNGKK